MRPEWKYFVGGKWENEVNVRDFIQKNYHLYEGDESFLAAPTQNTKDLWAQVLDLQKQEREAGGVLDMDTKHPTDLVIWTRAKRQSLASRQTNRSNVPYSLTAVSEWLRKPAPTTVTKLTLKSANFSQHTEKHTMPAASTLITQR